MNQKIADMATLIILIAQKYDKQLTLKELFYYMYLIDCDYQQHYKKTLTNTLWSTNPVDISNETLIKHLSFAKPIIIKEHPELKNSYTITTIKYKHKKPFKLSHQEQYFIANQMKSYIKLSQNQLSDAVIKKKTV